jgi:hypothetical protein
MKGIWIFFFPIRESGYMWTSHWCIYFIRSIQTSTSSTKSSPSINLHICRSPWSEGHNCLAISFFPSSFFMHCTLRGGFSHEVFPLSSFFQCSFIRCIVKWVPNMALLLGPILHLHPSSVQGGCWRYYTLT